MSNPTILSIAQFTEQIKTLLEGAFGEVWVAGEISNFSRPQSGHCYLTLKDSQAQLRAVLWRNVAQRTRFDLHDGLEVTCRGSLDLYAPRGTYQLVIQEIQPRGLGALELALRQLQSRLAAEGLFAPERKRVLPPFPRRVGVVTSPSGAAIRDFLEVLRRRWRGVDVLVLPARVQGEGASEEVASAIELANHAALGLDVLVVTRGGGSLEDLWSFNEEVVVRAVFASRLPVISAIGHEIDVTLCDLVADVRALTPSEAAERVAPSAEALRAALEQRGRHLQTAITARLAAQTVRLNGLAARRPLRRPFDRVHELARRVDDDGARLEKARAARLERARQTLAVRSARLEMLSPLGVLARGYSITRRAEDGRLVRSSADVAPGERIMTRMVEDEVVSRVELVKPVAANRFGEPAAQQQEAGSE